MTTDTINTFVANGTIVGPHAMGVLNVTGAQTPALFVAGSTINLTAFNAFIANGGGVVCFGTAGLSVSSAAVADWVQSQVDAGIVVNGNPVTAVAIMSEIVNGTKFGGIPELSPIKFFLGNLSLGAENLSLVQFAALLEQAGYTKAAISGGDIVIS